MPHEGFPVFLGAWSWITRLPGGGEGMLYGESLCVTCSHRRNGIKPGHRAQPSKLAWEISITVVGSVVPPLPFPTGNVSRWDDSGCVVLWRLSIHPTSVV